MLVTAKVICEVVVADVVGVGVVLALTGASDNMFLNEHTQKYPTKSQHAKFTSSNVL